MSIPFRGKWGARFRSTAHNFSNPKIVKHLVYHQICFALGTELLSNHALLLSFYALAIYIRWL